MHDDHDDHDESEELPDELDFDWVLQSVIDIVEQGADERMHAGAPEYVRITVLSGGFLVTGDMISQREYALGVLDGALLEVLKRTHEAGDADDDQLAGEVEHFPYHHLHLKNVSFAQPVPTSPDENGVSYWRLHVDGVSGYTFASSTIGDA